MFVYEHMSYVKSIKYINMCMSTVKGICLSMNIGNSARAWKVICISMELCARERKAGMWIYLCRSYGRKMGSVCL